MNLSYLVGLEDDGHLFSLIIELLNIPAASILYSSYYTSLA